MTINLTQLDEDVLEALRNRGHSSEQIEQMNWDEVFDEYCEWRGLLRWGNTLRRVMTNAKNAQDAAPPGGAGFWKPAAQQS